MSYKHAGVGSIAIQVACGTLVALFEQYLTQILRELRVAVAPRRQHLVIVVPMCAPRALPGRARAVCRAFTLHAHHALGQQLAVPQRRHAYRAQRLLVLPNR